VKVDRPGQAAKKLIRPQNIYNTLNICYLSISTAIKINMLLIFVLT